VRELVPRHPVPAVAAGLLVGFQPMFAFISGAVNNDNGVNALAAIVVFLVVRGLRRGLTWRTGLALGVALVVLPLMKATGYELYPLSFLALVPMLWRHHRRADLIGFAALAGAFLVAYLGWHAISPSFESASAATVTAGSASVGGARDNLPGYLSYLWQIFLPPLPFMTDLQSFPAPYFHIYVERGFGAFGWYAVLFPDWVYQVIRLALLVSGAAGIAALWRNRVWVRRHLVEIAYVALVPVSVIAAVHAAYFTTEQRTVIPEFGRYAFPAMAALAAMAVGSTFALGRRRVVPLATGLVALMLVLNYAAQLLTLTGFYT
jgi:hypothetical protein